MSPWKRSKNDLPTSRAIRLAEGLEVTDWEGINERMLARIAEVDRPPEYWKERFTHSWTEQRRLGTKLAHWARLIGMAAGIPVNRNPSDDEAEAILIGWATTQALKIDALGRIDESAVANTLAEAQPFPPAGDPPKDPWDYDP